MNKKSILIAMIFGTFICYANPIAKNKFSVIEKEALTKEKKKKEHLVVKDAKGNIVFKQEIKSNVISLSSQGLENLKDGKYTLEIEKGYEIKITPFHVVNGVSQFLKDKAKTVFMPVFRKEDNKVLISQLAVNSEPLEITLFFEGEKIYSDTVQGSKVLERVYSLSKKASGNYKVIMKANDRIYIKKFSL